jgi:hypothetical protein
MKTCGESRGIASRPGHFTPRKGDPVSNGHEPVWFPETWPGRGGEEKNLPLPEFEPQYNH